MILGVEKEFRPQNLEAESHSTHNKAACPNCIAHDPQFSQDPADLVLLKMVPDQTQHLQRDGGGAQ